MFEQMARSKHVPPDQLSPSKLWQYLRVYGWLRADQVYSHKLVYEKLLLKLTLHKPQAYALNFILFFPFNLYL